MMTLENTIDADTEALQMFAKDFRNVSVFTNHMVIPAPTAGKCNSVIRRNIIGTIELTAPEICLREPNRRGLLRLKFLRILEEAGHDH